MKKSFFGLAVLLIIFSLSACQYLPGDPYSNYVGLRYTKSHLIEIYLPHCKDLDITGVNIVSAKNTKNTLWDSVGYKFAKKSSIVAQFTIGDKNLWQKTSVSVPLEKWSDKVGISFRTAQGIRVLPSTFSVSKLPILTGDQYAIYGAPTRVVSASKLRSSCSYN